MFNNLGNQPASGATNSAVDDIFAETDNSAAHQTQGGANIETQPAGLSAQPYLTGDGNDKNGHGRSKVKLILILALAILILAAAAYLAYSKFTRSSAESDLIPADNTVPAASTTPDVVATSTEDNNVVIPEPETPIVDNGIATQTPSTTIATETPIVVAPVDSDGDSLTDTEEDVLGTNVNLIDSDFDGLSDYEEVKVYGTNPLNDDTDSDTFKDGDEIKSGYNPKGEGQL